MSHTFLYQIGIIYFDDNIKRVQNTLVKMLEVDGYRIGVWTKEMTMGEDENAVDLYNFIRNQCEHTVLFVTPVCSDDPFFLQALRAQIQQMKLESGRSFLVIECGQKLLPEYKAKVICLDGSTACGVELAMQIENFFYPKHKQKKESENSSIQNIVITDMIKNSKLF